MIQAPFLHIGSHICILSPSGVVNPDFVWNAKDVLESWGLIVTIGKSVFAANGRFAGTDEERIADIQSAIDDNNCDAILCSRGGYGLARIIDKIDFSKLQERPKWILGFSDITLIHSALSLHGITSIHSIMTKNLALQAKEEPALRLKQLLFGELPSYSIGYERFNKKGTALGNLVGGNLSVIYGLRGTAFDLQSKNNILFIEDVCEPLYHIDRMIQNIRLGGIFNQISGLVVGQFTDIQEDTSFPDGVYGIIENAVKDYSFPVCYGFNAGHTDYNLPLILGHKTSLSVSDNGDSILTQNI